MAQMPQLLSEAALTFATGLFTCSIMLLSDTIMYFYIPVLAALLLKNFFNTRIRLSPQCYDHGVTQANRQFGCSTYLRLSNLTFLLLNFTAGIDMSQIAANDFLSTPMYSRIAGLLHAPS